MPKYSITVQRNVSPDAAGRASRASEFKDVDIVEMQAPTITDALLKYNVRTAQETTTPPRVVAVEELLIVDPDELADESIVHALRTAPSPIPFDDYDDEIIVEDFGYGSLVHDIADALRESAVLPGLSVSILRDEDGVFDYAMVEIHDQATGTYRSVGRDPEGLIGDRTLTGRAGIVSVARTLIEIAAGEHLL